MRERTLFSWRGRFYFKSVRERIAYYLFSHCAVSSEMGRIDKRTNLWTCAPSEDSEQPAHLRRLIGISTGRILDRQKAKILRAVHEN